MVYLRQFICKLTLLKDGLKNPKSWIYGCQGWAEWPIHLPLTAKKEVNFNPGAFEIFFQRPFKRRVKPTENIGQNFQVF